MLPFFNCDPHIHNLIVRLSVLGEVVQHSLLPTPFFFSLLLYFSFFSTPHSLYNSLPSIPSSVQDQFLWALNIKGKYHFDWFCPKKGHDDHDSFLEWKHRFSATGALKKALLYPSHFEGNKEWCWQRKACDLVVKKMPWSDASADTHALPNCSTAKNSYTPISFLPILSSATSTFRNWCWISLPLQWILPSCTEYSGKIHNVFQHPLFIYIMAFLRKSQYAFYWKTHSQTCWSVSKLSSPVPHKASLAAVQV